MLKKIRHFFEAFLAFTLFGIFRMLGLDWASAVGAWLARRIGPLTHFQQRARRNLAHVGMAHSKAQEEKILRGVWDNLGRVIAEYVYLGQLQLYDDKPLTHQGKIYKNRVRIVNRERLEQCLKNDKGAIFFAAHTANWEMSALCVTSLGYKLSVAYRAPRNPWVNRMIAYLRRPVAFDFADKDARGGRLLMKALKKGEAIGIVSDQKVGEFSLPFLGKKARTLEMPARLSLRFDIPLVPVHVVREGGSYFTLTAQEPLKLTDTQKKLTRKKQEEILSQKMNDCISNWIKAHPDQWLWIHDKWKLKGY